MENQYLTSVGVQIVLDGVFTLSAAHTSSNSSVVFPAFDRQIFQPINALKTLMKDNNIRFRTFICLSMSKGMLTAWLEALPKQKSEWGYMYLFMGNHC